MRRARGLARVADGVRGDDLARRPGVASAASVARVGVVQLARAAAGRRARRARRRWPGSPRVGGGRSDALPRPAPTATPISAGADARAGAQRRSPGAEVLARAADVAPGRDLVVEGHAVAVARHELDLERRRRRRRASRRRSRCGSPRRRRARRRPGAPARDSPTMRSARPRRAERTAKPSIARIGEGGHVALGDDVLGQHAAERILDRDVLGGQRAHGGENLRARLVDRDGHGQIIAAVRPRAPPGGSNVGLPPSTGGRNDVRRAVRVCRRAWLVSRWRCPRPRSAPGARIRSPTCRRSARGRPGAGQGLAARAGGRAAAARRAGAADPRPRARRSGAVRGGPARGRLRGRAAPAGERRRPRRPRRARR